MNVNPARTQRFNNRIQAGANDGSINGDERNALRGQRAGIKALYDEFKGNDGVIGPKELRRLRHERNQLSQNIYQFRHNG